MANVKQIKIIGAVPFNCDSHHGMRNILAQMNSPWCGLKIKWNDPEPFVSGKLTMYGFEISGQEAVSNKWIENMIQAIVDCGGNTCVVNVYDVENNMAFQQIDKPIKPNESLYWFTVAVDVEVKTDVELVKILIGDYMQEIVKTGKAIPPKIIENISIIPEKWSSRKA